MTEYTMEIEQLEIRDYLSHRAPLDKLNDQLLDTITHALEISYIRRGKELLTIGQDNQTLYLIRSGAMAVYDAEGKLQGQFTEGDWVGYRSVLAGGKVSLSIRAMEDSLLYMIPGELFKQLVDQYDFVKTFFSRQKPERLRGAIQDIRNSSEDILAATQVKNLLHGEPLIISPSTSITELAKQMTEHGYTTALVVDNNTLIGIVNDRSFCTKLAYHGLSLDEPVTQIMTSNPLTIPADSMGSDALLTMAEFNIRRLPVVDGQKLLGVVTATDLIRRQSHNTIYLINEIYRAKNISQLRILSKHIPVTLSSLVAHGMNSYDTGHAISSIGKAIVRRMIYFAEKKLGPAPVSYAWIVAGSMARNEQTGLSDQDNGLILSSEYNENIHAKYFEKLSQIVCDGLNDCGYIYCPGDVMATNIKWRQPVNVWRQYFNQWIDEPEPIALMHASIFFDLVCVYGDSQLLDEVQRDILAKTRDNTIFLRHLTTNALSFKPPIGLFRNFVLEETGSEHKALNLKKRGVVPIIDLARVYALSAGISAINTRERIEAAHKAGILSHEGMEDLLDALEFISTVRLQHQALQAREAVDIDNYVSPENLSSLERRHLKDAFDVVRTMQSVLEQRN